MAESKTPDGLSYLTCDMIGDLDHGFAREVINNDLAAIFKDLDDRGEDGKPRTLTIKLTATKIGDRGDVKVEFATETKVPSRTLQPTVAILRTQNGRPLVAFRADNPERPDQPTIPYDGDDAGKGE